MHVSSVMSAIGGGWAYRAGEAHVVFGPKGQIDGKVLEDDNGAARALFWPLNSPRCRCCVFAFAQFSRYPFTPFPENKVL